MKKYIIILALMFSAFLNAQTKETKYIAFNSSNSLKLIDTNTQVLERSLSTALSKLSDSVKKSEWPFNLRSTPRVRLQKVSGETLDPIAFAEATGTDLVIDGEITEVVNDIYYYEFKLWDKQAPNPLSSTEGYFSGKGNSISQRNRSLQNEIANHLIGLLNSFYSNYYRAIDLSSDSYETAGDAPTVISQTVKLNRGDTFKIDIPEDNSKVAIIQKPINGTASYENGSLTYKSAKLFVGDEKLSYLVGLDNGLFSIGNLSFQISNVSPKSKNINKDLTSGSKVVIDLDEFVQFNRGDVVDYNLQSLNTIKGDIITNGSQITYFSPDFYSGTEVIRYNFSDELGNKSNTSSITFKVSLSSKDAAKIANDKKIADERKAREEARILAAQQEREREAQRQAALDAQQEREREAQRQAALAAQQEREREAQRQAALAAQQERDLKIVASDLAGSSSDSSDEEKKGEEEKKGGSNLIYILGGLLLLAALGGGGGGGGTPTGILDIGVLLP